MGESAKRDKINNILTWMGAVVAGISIVVYVAVVVILVEGFEQVHETSNLTIFSIIGAADGLLVSNSLRLQGVALAKNLPESREIIKRLAVETKVKHRSITWHLIWSFIQDVFTKGVTIGFSTYFMVSIVIEGLKDDKYILLALANIFLFVGFGLIALARAFDFYLEHHIPLLKQKLKDQASRSVDSVKENEF